MLIALRMCLIGAVAFFLAASLLMAGIQIVLIATGSDALDWAMYVAATERFWTGNLYESAEWWYGWRYSPVAVFPLMLLAPLGETAWRLLLGLALVGLPGRLRLLALASYPFWFAIHAGNAIVFVVVAAYWAVRGNVWAIGIFLALALLIPRPLMAPIVLWILLRHPPWRLRFLIMFVVHGVMVLATGYLGEWLAKLVATTGEEIVKYVNVGPSAIIGLSWMVVAVPVAIWAFRAGRPALSGLLLQPYWLPYYLLMPLSDRWPPVSWWRDRFSPLAVPRLVSEAPVLSAAAVESVPPAAGQG